MLSTRNWNWLTYRSYSNTLGKIQNGDKVFLMVHLYIVAPFTESTPLRSIIGVPLFLPIIWWNFLMCPFYWLPLLGLLGATSKPPPDYASLPSNALLVVVGLWSKYLAMIFLIFTFTRFILSKTNTWCDENLKKYLLKFLINFIKGLTPM